MSTSLPQPQLDALTWEAVYRDGTSLWEHEHNTYKDIDRTRLITFRVYATNQIEDPAKKPILTLELKPEYRLIWRKRRLQRLFGTTPFMTIYLVGWQATIGGKNVQSILYMYPDGTLILSGDKSDIELFDFEE